MVAALCGEANDSRENLQLVSGLNWHGQRAWSNHSGSEWAAGSPATPSRRPSTAPCLRRTHRLLFAFWQGGKRLV